MNSRGLSAIIANIFMVVIVVIAVGIVGVFIMNLIRNNSSGSTSTCIDALEQIEINNEYTCYDSSTNTMKVSVNVGRIVVDSVTILVDSASHLLITPTNNTGYSENIEGVISKPSSVRIAPIINENQCDVVDSISNVVECAIE